MKKYKVIAFDLDGTLTNPERGLIQGFVYAFKRLGIEYGEPSSLRRFIGPPLYEEWQREFGFSFEEASHAIEVFREYYNVYGWRENEVYPGIEELLGALSAAGKTLIVATSKPEVTAKKVLRLFGLDKYFSTIAGASSDGSSDSKSIILKRAIENTGYAASACILVGDRKYDAEGARTVGADSLGVLWGHGSEEELNSAPFTAIAKTPEEVKKMLSAEYA